MAKKVREDGIMLSFLLTIERLTGEPTEQRIMDYAIDKEVERINRAASALLDKVPQNITKCKWRRWNKLNA